MREPYFINFRNSCKHLKISSEIIEHEDSVITNKIYYCKHWDRESSNKRCTQAGCKIWSVNDGKV